MYRFFEPLFVLALVLGASAIVLDRQPERCRHCGGAMVMTLNDAWTCPRAGCPGNRFSDGHAILPASGSVSPASPQQLTRPRPDVAAVNRADRNPSP